MRSLREAFREIGDWREDQVEYPVEGLLCLVCIAVLCGCNGINEMERFGERYRWELSERLGFRRHRMPKHGTLQRLARQVNEAAVSRIVAAWGEEVLQTQKNPTLTGIAIDGKVLRGTRQGEVPAVEVISALSHDLLQVLGQKTVPSETNEIKGIMPLLADLVLEGRIVTVDALLTQRNIAATIREKGGIT